MSSRRSRIGQKSVSFDDEPEDEISFRSVFNSVRDAMSVFSIESIREATSDIMSLLSNPTQDGDEGGNSIQDIMSAASTPRGGNPGSDHQKQSTGSVISKREVQSMTDHFPSHWRRNEDESSYSSQVDDCNFCGIVGMDESLPSTARTKNTSAYTRNAQQVGDRSFCKNLRSLKRDCDFCANDFSDDTFTCSTRTERTDNKSQQLEVQSCLF